ncbi:hypothetical protein [Synechococcus sp. MIT S1220]|uniref:hypothetical protein n=1 Tax=Synechococcus sp. MIT S1220 TaxID=3082549 RepID=UPI0039B0B198
MFKLKTQLDAHYNGLKLVVFDQDGNKLASRKPERKKSHFLFDKSEISDGTSPINISLKLIDINKKKPNISINKTDYTLSSKRQFFDLTVPAKKDNYKLTINPQLTNVGSAIILDDFNAGRSILIGNSNPAVITKPNFDDAKFPAKDSNTNLETIETPNLDDIGVPTKDPTSNLDTIKNPNFDGNKVPTESPIPRSKYLAFSGGGFNSHSFLSGMLSGALDRRQEESKNQPSKTGDFSNKSKGQASKTEGLNINSNPFTPSEERDNAISFSPSQGRDLKHLMSNVSGISGNSGGSWFLTALAFSEDFSSEFESKVQMDRFFETGYYGQLRDIFENDLFYEKTLGGNKKRLLAYRKYLKNIADWQWTEVVKNTSYGPYNMKSDFINRDFNSPRVEWADDIHIIINASLFQSDAIIYGDEGLGTFRDIHSRITTPSHQPNGNFATPIAFYSKAENPGYGNSKIAYMKLLSGSDGKNKLRKEQTFGNDHASIDIADGSDQNIGISGMRIMEPSMGSSAAFGIMAAQRPDSLFQWFEELRGSKLAKLAPLASINKHLNQFNFEKEIEVRKNDYNGIWEDIKDEGYTRVTDGGYTDNTSAANLMRFIQEEDGTDTPFEMTIFKQASIPLDGSKDKNNDVIPLGDTSLSADLAGLFGADGGFDQQDGDLVEFCAKPLGCRDVVTSQVFDSSAWDGVTSPSWEYTINNLGGLFGGIFVRYFELDVITVDNAAFGVQGGQQGKVRIFYSNNSESLASPKTLDQYDQYQRNFDAYRDIIQKDEPYATFEDAFGL